MIFQGSERKKIKNLNIELKAKFENKTLLYTDFRQILDALY